MAEYQTVQIPIAVNGLNKDLQPTQIPSASPNMKNMYVENWGVRKRLGYIQSGLNLPLAGIGMELMQYIDARGIVHQIALTTTCAFEYDSSYNQWIEIMPSVQMQACELDTDWTAGTNITLSQSTENYEGTYALKILATDAISAGDKIASTTTFDNDDISGVSGTVSHISFWYYASKAGVSIKVRTKDADTDVDAVSYIDSPSAEKWYHCCVKVDLSGISTVTSIEIYTETALAADDYIVVDDIRASDGFSSDASNRWSHSTAHDATLFSNNGGTALCISNNVDSIYYYEGNSSGSGSRFAALDLSDLSGFAYAKEIIEFWNHFFVINYNNGSTNVRSLAYSNLGDIDDFTGGTSGSNVLTDTIGKLLRARKLGSDMVIYSENTITTGRYLGGAVLFMFPTLVYETGLFAEKALWDFVNVHYFLGTDQKIYGYAGGRQLTQIGTAIEESMFNELDVSKKNAVVFGLDVGRHKLHVFFPTASSAYAKQCYSYNYKHQKRTWEYHEFADTVRDFSLFSNKIPWYCDGPEVAGHYCDELNLYSDSSFTESDYPVATFISSDGYVFKITDSTGKDDDSDIECVYETMDITIDAEEHYFRTAWVSFNAMSAMVDATVDVYYSIDSGDTWTSIASSQSVSLGDANVWTQHRIPFDASARKIRFKFVQNSSKDFQLRAMHMKYLLEGDR